MRLFGSRRRNRVEDSAPLELFLRSWTPHVPTFRESIPRLEAELRRSRRYERPLSILVLGLDTPALRANGRPAGRMAIGEVGVALPDHIAFYLLGWLLCDSVRDSDLVMYVAQSHLYALLLPETRERDATQVALRIGQLLTDRTTASLQVGTAEFPRDGFTVEDLFDRAQRLIRAYSLTAPLEPPQEVCNG